MKSVLWIVTLVLISVWAMPGMADAAAQGPKPKLPAPANLTCPLLVDPDLGNIAVISWDDDPDAFAWQVQSTCLIATVADPLAVSASMITFTPAVGLPVAEACMNFSVRVRALPGPKHEGGPAQGGGPKGQWSDPCVVELVVQ
jgi:hypothetical protein